jgi:DNA-binding transcriptional MerR regulator
MKEYITAGELAKLACTTKRTIHFYGEKGVLRPTYINKKKYRYYKEDQVLEYQMILLLTTLGISLDEIKRYIRKNGNLNKLFNEKKMLIQEEIKRLQFNLDNLNEYMKNLHDNGTMVKPVIKNLSPFGVYYIEKIGAYAEIDAFCTELVNMFEKGSKMTTLSIFYDSSYQPKKSRMKIGVLAKNGIKVKKEFRTTVQYFKFNPGKVITYTHNGSGSLLSLFWKELEKYCKNNKIKVRTSTPDFEIYRDVNEDVTKQFFEIYLPIF